MNPNHLNYQGSFRGHLSEQLIGWSRAFAVFLLVNSLALNPVLACKLPVFRYALERWPVDQYRFVALISHPDSPVVKDAIQALQENQDSSWNAEIEFVNLNEITEEQWWQYEGLEGGSQDRLQVYFPSEGKNKRLGWQGELTRESIQSWASSPAREDLIQELSRGVSAVWWLIEGEDLQQADQIEMEMKAILNRANQEISIPDGVISQADAAEYFQLNPGASMDDVLRCSVPLRVDFRLRRLSPEDARELGTLAMLRALGVNDLQNSWLVPIFGRGRMLDAIPVERFDPSVVMNACKYMVGECSCTVKTQNPGADLLLSMNWEKELGVEALVMGATNLLPPVLLSIPEGQDLLPATQDSEESIQGASPSDVVSSKKLSAAVDRSEAESSRDIGVRSFYAALPLVGLILLAFLLLIKRAGKDSM